MTPWQNMAQTNLTCASQVW
jgi:aspartyl-tRNA synthetase